MTQFRGIIGTILLTKFHEDRTRNVAFECLQTKCGRMDGRRTTDGRTDDGQRPILKAHLSNQKNAPSSGNHVFQSTRTILELLQNIIVTNLLIKFHEDRTMMWPLETIKKNCPVHSCHVFEATYTIFKLGHDVIGTNMLTKFHDDQTINVASSVLTKAKKNALPSDIHVFQTTRTIFLNSSKIP
ncbi:hypothetical protein DPMN_130789 [Dreissena polymorpha]|uniref:Uncharacterized protein n=1 Tax=Dreissena polymorpha TaxID=45954 RepID=A0A9D4H5A6_DREPO|nr:hypothetical protein DPMN_130789 [Dreissena polymorpha]